MQPKHITIVLIIATLIGLGAFAYQSGMLGNATNTIQKGWTNLRSNLNIDKTRQLNVFSSDRSESADINLLQRCNIHVMGISVEAPSAVCDVFWNGSNEITRLQSSPYAPSEELVSNLLLSKPFLRKNNAI